MVGPKEVPDSLFRRFPDAEREEAIDRLVFVWPMASVYPGFLAPSAHRPVGLVLQSIPHQQPG